MQMLPDDPEVLQMLHECMHESEPPDEVSVQADSGIHVPGGVNPQEPAA